MKQIKPDKYKSYLQHNLIELEYLKFEIFENLTISETVIILNF